MSEIISSVFYKDGLFYSATDHHADCSQKEIFYEVIRLMDSVPLFLRAHLQRMVASIRYEKKVIITEKQLKLAIQAFLKRDPFDTGNLKVMVCFGSVSSDYSLVVYRVQHYYPVKEAYEKGVVVCTSLMQRKNPTVKKWNQSLKEKVFALRQEANVFEVLLSDAQGNISEGSKTNIFFISQGRFITAPIEEVLPGITRQKVIDIAEAMNVVVQYESINIEHLATMEGVFLTGTSPKVLPVRQVNDVRFPVHSKIMLETMKRYEQLLANEVEYGLK